jgi:signal transduction histidine kinase
MRPDEGLVGLVAETLRPLCVEDATAHPRFKYFPEAGEDRYHSFLGVPLLDRGVSQGVLVVQTVDPRSFSADEISMLTAAGAQLAPIVSDVRIERRRLLEHDMLRQAKADMVQTLVGGMAHELNNKLMPVVGFSEVLIEEATRSGAAQFLEYARVIHEGALEASRIIRQLHQISRPGADAEHVPCDLRETTEQAIKLVALRVKEAEIALDVQLPAAPVMVKADAGQIKQVVVNLVWNAIDAMKTAADRRLVVHLEATGKSATLSCIDRGAGIAPDILPRIFDPFFTTKGPTAGTGLGLSLCFAIVKQHGGNIRVQSAPGAGAAFHVVLPLHT